ncbi:MAG: hypothetical protein K2Q34_03755 [Alphaproteobacteria bacterium]|nr:hypothetical protein [Alphaproteobacteria bacterium]
MNIPNNVIKKLKQNYGGLALLEAIDGFYQIRGLVTEESSKHPCQLHESLLELHRLLLILIQDQPEKEPLKEDHLRKIINLIEEDAYRITYNADIILATIYKVKSSIFPQDIEFSRLNRF